MGNIFFNDKVSQDLFLQMSNGATDVFVCLLSLSCSQIASTKEEIRIASCICSCDQSIFGRGCTGFDIAELPWSQELSKFKNEKQFLLKAIKRVLERTDWHKLDYEPTVDRALVNQTKFFEMVTKFEFQHVCKFDPNNFSQLNESGDKCSKHGVYLNAKGCVVCNGN